MSTQSQNSQVSQPNQLIAQELTPKADELIIDIGILSEIPLEQRKAKVQELKDDFENKKKLIKVKSCGRNIEQFEDRVGNR